MKKIAFAGLRHGHINSLYNEVINSAELEIGAICEEDADALRAFLSAHPENKAPVFDSLEKMLAEVPCEIVAIGDYYGKRGSVAIAALKAGKHVIADKPLCTSLEELDEIEKLSREKHLAVGLMLDLRTYDQFVKARELVRSGQLGKITQIQFGGQHPLLKESRPHW